ncbi:hypothetical protein A2572_02690 [Candidatus Collierbacteria bacterium RIFOXYD1_FULL_40_9]|uniref:HEPN domain-containing protein n=1 Tax=Candidatus Collierbacteria bacterium RIFOXYD1_FULL_40_9 TaxID=1817731 RepID=A0A1F5FW65_9BACT|nr:MAG: hypothetical protein A2572_02690 [Candidatus Collierbacteria bacterium RIFOXYD1_FULL_40_9]
MNIKALLDQVKNLKLPSGEYAIFGSATLAIRNLREAPNIDLIVTNKLWQNLLASNIPDEEGFIRIGHVKISNWWFAPTKYSIDKMIAMTELIDELPFVPLNLVADYKKKLNRQKDIDDIVLIGNYLKHQTPDRNNDKEIAINFCDQVNKKLDDKILSIILFGSVARDQTTPESDIDIFLVYNDKQITHKQLTKQITKILVETNTQPPAIYPFLVPSSLPLHELPVFYDASIEGLILKDNQNIASASVQKIINSNTKRISLPSGKWVWINLNKKMMSKKANLLTSASQESLLHAKESFGRGSWNMSIRRSQEAVELVTKASLAKLQVDYPKDHDQAPLLLRILKAKGILVTPDEENNILKISTDLSRKRGPALQYEIGYDKETASHDLASASYVIETLNRIMCQKL